MHRTRLRIVLLALGVLVGYGSAFAHHAHHRDHYSHCHHNDCGCERDCH